MKSHVSLSSSTGTLIPKSFVAIAHWGAAATHTPAQGEMALAGMAYLPFKKNGSVTLKVLDAKRLLLCTEIEERPFRNRIVFRWCVVAAHRMALQRVLPTQKAVGRHLDRPCSIVAY